MIKPTGEASGRQGPGWPAVSASKGRQAVSDLQNGAVMHPMNLSPQVISSRESNMPLISGPNMPKPKPVVVFTTWTSVSKDRQSRSGQ